MAIVMVCGILKTRVLTRGVGWPTSIRNRDDNICKMQEKREARYNRDGNRTYNRERDDNRTYNRERDDNKNDKHDEQAKVALEAKMTAMQTAMEAAAQQVADYGIQVDLGFEKFRK